MINRRFVFSFAILIVTIHFALTLTHEHYSKATHNAVSLLGEQWHYINRHRITENVPSNHERQGMAGDWTTCATATPTPPTTTSPVSPPPPPQRQRANATLMMLARNSDLWDVIGSVKSMEDRFNRRYGYPWVLLNDEEFTQEFKSRVLAVTNAKVEFGTIPKDHWQQPESIDETRASNARNDMVAKGILYGGSVSYRNMCRFNSGFFYRHELLAPYKYYWRVEPNVKFFCNLDYDPFHYMADNNKTYGFTIALEEFPDTVASLWDTVKDFKRQNGHLIAQNNAEAFLSEDKGETYNMCHFWSNFEIASLDFWRSAAYSKFFEQLDITGGFYYERWGDAPVHSIAAALLLPKEQLHFFADVGYRHEPFQHCPQGDMHARGQCSCDPGVNFDYQGWASCMDVWDGLWKT